VTGEEALAQAVTLAGPNGEEMLRQFLSSEFTPNFARAEIEKIIESSLAVPRDYAAKLMLSISYSDYRDVLPRIRRPHFVSQVPGAHSERRPCLGSRPKSHMRGYP
jgi:hypothetical protein